MDRSGTWYFRRDFTLAAGEYDLPLYDYVDELLEEVDFVGIIATWYLPDQQPADSFVMGFRVLGTYRHSQYVTVRESSCVSPPR